METRPDRFTAFADANVLVPALWRNLLLTLAEAHAYRIRFSAQVLDETRRALRRDIGLSDAVAERQVARIRDAFRDGVVAGYEPLIGAFGTAPDPGDAHVMAAALSCGAGVIVTENLRDFPDALLGPLGIEAVGIDDFLADAVDLDQERAAAAIRIMRLGLKRPEMDPAALLASMRAHRLPQTAALLEGIADQL